MKNLIITLIITACTAISFAQEKTVALEEVEVTGVNYKYLDALGDGFVAKPVKILEQKVANFDLTSIDGYEDEENEYFVYFKIPVGKILAVYDKDGEIMRTSEKFKDIRLPLAVSNAIVEKYPGWSIEGDIYLVKYIKDEKISKTYKLFLQKNGEHKRVKTDDNGNFL
ncbi:MULTISPECIES: nicotinate-nucleotide adenylyltransferase [Flavobacteriaceae]|uniref:Nicotinate-nucleotide adenylyltransferase n=2 Tax=Flavobacteriaceae TaxID=49546 RepID=A0A4Y8AXB2_9FLAO|nr:MULTISPECIES: nicotinate-nucleotide adenylyltransferase [Flavobacteriaceae]TEW76638.1 nicotinate-nucleotide adenylyltransferase [Gramella jeungdoensis]GGK51327.1 hypothetical protein GCM10007963_19590 [Lutibacter litoralis]